MRWVHCAILTLVVLASGADVRAHGLAAAFVSVETADDHEADVLIKLPQIEGNTPSLSVRFADECEELTTPTRIKRKDGVLERWSIRCERPLTGMEIELEGLNAILGEALVEFRSPSTQGWSTVVRRGLPTTRLGAPSSQGLDSKAGYFPLGIEHILSGFDHVFFVLALLLIVWRTRAPYGRRAVFKSMLVTITAFTVGHSITLAAATLGLVRLAPAPTELVIALSVLLLAVELARDDRSTLTYALSVDRRVGLWASPRLRLCWRAGRNRTSPGGHRRAPLAVQPRGRSGTDHHCPGSRLSYWGDDLDCRKAPTRGRSRFRLRQSRHLWYWHSNCLLVLRTKPGMDLGMKQLWIAACAVGALSLGCTEESGAGACEGTEEACGTGGAGGAGQVICDDIDQGLRVLWGDTHVHTRLSLDSFWFNSLAGPREAYQFAKGGTVDIACDDRTVPCETRQLDRPLDFTAVSEHAEFLGLFDEQCRGDDIAPTCGIVEQTILDNIDALIMGTGGTIDPDMIMALFPNAAPRSEAWQQVIADAEAENDPCTFTTFSAYEHSPQINGSMMHRNVLFVGDDLPDDVFSLQDSQDSWDLLDHLEQECGSSSDCDYLTIPHNPNNSTGRMFLPVGIAGRGNQPLTPEDAALRAKADAVVEMHQAKGQSECMAGNGFDGLGDEEMDMDCFFEPNKPVCLGLPQDDPRCLPPAEAVCTSITGDVEGEAVPFNCSSPNDFMRGAMAEGLKAREIVGLNPYQLGFIGSTDTHNANPSDVDETIYRGIAGALDNNPETQLGEWTCDLDDPECTRSPVRADASVQQQPRRDGCGLGGAEHAGSDLRGTPREANVLDQRATDRGAQLRQL